MLALTSTSDSIQLVTSSTATTDVHATWISVGATVDVPARKNTAITTATTTTIVPSPASGAYQSVKAISIRNKHASTAQTVTLLLGDGVTSVELIKVTLEAGESLHYQEDGRFQVLDANGESGGSSVDTSALVLRSGSDMTGPLGLLSGQSGSNARRADETIWNVGGAARIPSWTTAGRPLTPSSGDLGNNTTLGSLEVSNGSTWNKLRITGGTTASLAGTAVDVTGIPSWATWVNLDFFDASTSTASDILIQLGSSSGIESTTYKTSAAYSGGSATTAAVAYADGFVFRSVEPSLLCGGDFELKKVSGNKYSGYGTLGSNGVYLGYCGGGKELAGALDRIRILPRSGSFDGGTVSVTWGN